jgi:hypothetical protein
MDPQSIPLPFPVNVQFWISNEDESRQKAKVCALHPVHTWIISADKTSVAVWDYARQQCIMEKSLADIINSIGKGGRQGRHHPVLTSKNTDTLISSRTYQSKSPRVNGYHQHNISRIGAISEPPSALKLKDVGDVKCVTFVDRVAMQWQCGGASIPPTTDSFHNSSRVMIEFDTAVIFFDFAQQSAVYVITTADLGKQSPTCAAFIFPELCAVGCSDGNIR